MYLKITSPVFEFPEFAAELVGCHVNLATLINPNGIDVTSGYEFHMVAVPAILRAIDFHHGADTATRVKDLLIQTRGEQFLSETVLIHGSYGEVVESTFQLFQTRRMWTSAFIFACISMPFIVPKIDEQPELIAVPILLGSIVYFLMEFTLYQKFSKSPA